MNVSIGLRTHAEFLIVGKAGGRTGCSAQYCRSLSVNFFGAEASKAAHNETRKNVPAAMLIRFDLLIICYIVQNAGPLPKKFLVFMNYKAKLKMRWSLSDT